MSIREVLESPVYMGSDEAIIWTLDTLPWGAGVLAAEATTLYHVQGSTETDVSTTNLSGDTVLAGTEIQSKVVNSLTPGEKYRLVFSWTLDGNALSAFMFIYGEK